MDIASLVKLSDYGISIIVIASLFYILFYFIKSSTLTTEKIHTDHLEERREWRRITEQHTAVHSKLIDALTDLTIAVRTQKKINESESL
mgnify:CR=1 FL=1|tara:strand:- start:7323 stop:7589 length:267 start_codon:yes stop_codon:yes gene_type:complete